MMQNAQQEQAVQGSALQQKKLRVLAAFLAILLAAAALVSSSYAWLSISRTPIVSDLELTVLTESRLEVAPDDGGRPGEWDVVLDLSSLLADMVPLRPVTYSKENNAMYTPLYDIDGRFTGQTVALSDGENANVKGAGNPAAEEQGYYLAVDFWLRGAQNSAILLTEAVEVDEGLAGSGTYVIGKPEWNGETLTHENGGYGLESAIRIGFRCQETDMEGNPMGSSRFVVYEPNCDLHVSGESQEYIETVSIDGGSLVDPETLIRQTGSTWTETAPVLNDSVVYTLGTFEDDPVLCNISTSTMQKITMYVWLEGRDVDCVNQVMMGQTSILGCIQLHGDGEEHNTGITRD